MVKPIRNQTPKFLETPTKKKPIKEEDLRVKNAIKKSKLPILEKKDRSLKASQKIAPKDVSLSAEKASYAARQTKIEIQKAGVRAQKRAFLAQRAHMAQQAAAAKRAHAAAKAKKAAERAAKKALVLRRIKKIKYQIQKITS